jgi:hypothetical protein
MWGSGDLVIWVVYLAGVALGLVVMRDPWPARVTTALLWPLGLAAFAIVLATLLVSAAILWPLPVLGAALVIGLAGWLLFA